MFIDSKNFQTASILTKLANTHSLLSGSLALEALLIGVHCKKRYINVEIQYNNTR